MTQQETKNLLLGAINDLELLVYYSDLLKIGIEQADSCNERNSERLFMLAETYQSIAEYHTDELKFALNELLNSMPE